MQKTYSELLRAITYVDIVQACLLTQFVCWHWWRVLRRRWSLLVITDCLVKVSILSKPSYGRCTAGCSVRKQTNTYILNENCECRVSPVELTPCANTWWHRSCLVIDSYNIMKYFQIMLIAMESVSADGPNWWSLPLTFSNYHLFDLFVQIPLQLVTCSIFTMNRHYTYFVNDCFSNFGVLASTSF